tara:strand:+ start:76444 stop:77184 length:741 start_codon:yes stop_codon:yes gene_type:complete
MIENINEIKYPVIVEVADDGGNFCIYESPTSVANLTISNKAYVEDEPIQKDDTICTKEFLQGKYVRVKCPTDILFLMKLGVNGGYSAHHNLLNSVDLISKTPEGVPVYIVFNEKGEMLLELTPNKMYYSEVGVPFPESIYQKEGFVSEEFLSQANRPTTEALSEEVEQEISTNGGGSLAERLHSLSERYTLFYSFHPKDDSPAEGGSSKSYFLVDYKEVSYKVDSVVKVGDLEKMIMIERGLCYEE